MISIQAMLRGSWRPILVTGSHRSGTSWISNIISSHPNVRLRDELIFNVSFSNKKTKDDFYPEHWFQYISHADGYKYLYKIKKNLSYQSYFKKVIQEHFEKEMFSPARMNQLLSRLLKFRLLVKEPIGIFSAEWLASQFDMDVIVTIRHPAAFAASLKDLNWTFDFNNLLKQPLLMKNILYPFESEIKAFATSPPDIIDQAILLWKIIYYRVSQYKEKNPDWTFVRLEDVALNPHERFAEIFQKLRLSVHPSVSSAIDQTTSSKNPWMLTSKDRDRFSIKRDSRKSIEAWKLRLREKEIQRLRLGVENVSKEFYGELDWQ